MVDGGRFFIVKLQKPAIYLESLTTVSTWLDTSILMSEPPDVRGNKSSRFHLKISKFASSASSPLVRGNISTISGNPREMGLFRESGWSIVSTQISSASAWVFIVSTLVRLLHVALYHYWPPAILASFHQTFSSL